MDARKALDEFRAALDTARKLADEAAPFLPAPFRSVVPILDAADNVVDVTDNYVDEHEDSKAEAARAKSEAIRLTAKRPDGKEPCEPCEGTGLKGPSMCGDCDGSGAASEA